MRIGLLLLLALALIPAGAADAACTDGARTTRTTERRHSVQSAVLACQNGRERTIRRGTISTKENGKGTFYAAASLGGDRLGIMAITRAKGRESNVVELLAARTGKRLFRSADSFYEDPDVDPILIGEQVAVTASGALAWTETGSDVRLRRPDGRVEKLANRANEAGELVVEDGTTLRYGPASRLQFLDLARPAGTPCPLRQRFRTTGTVGTIRLSTAQYRVEDDRSSVIRACDPATGADAVLGLAWNAGREDASVLTVHAASAPYVAFTRFERGPSECEPLEVTVVDVRTGRPAKRARSRGTGTRSCGVPANAPVTGQPLVLTTSGAPAWIGKGRLYAIRTHGRISTLDRGPVTDLTADGATVRWRRNGVDRSATL